MRSRFGFTVSMRMDLWKVVPPTVTLAVVAVAPLAEVT